MHKSFLPLLLLSLIFLGCNTLPEDSTTPIEKPPVEDDGAAVQNFDEVEKALLEGDSQGAIENLEDYQEENPEDINAKVLYAILLMSQGEIDKARTILEDVLEEESEHKEGLFNLALLEGFTGNREAQLNILLQLKELYPEEGDVHSALGDYYLADDNKELAKESYSKAIELDPTNVSALAGLGSLLLAEKDYEGAEQKFLQAAELYPNDPFVHTDLSRARIAQGRYAEAGEDLDRAVELAPEDYWIRMDRAKLQLNKLLRADLALEDLNKAVELDPEYFYAYIFRAGIYEETGKPQEAIADYRKLLQMRPDYYFAYQSLATLLYMEGEWEEARDNYEKAFAYEADYGFKLLAGLTLYRDGQDKEGKEYLQNFLDEIPRDDHFYAITRMAIDPGYEIFATRSIEGEGDRFVQTRMMFYMGAVMHGQGADVLAMDYYFQVKDRNLFGMYEMKIATSELAALGADDE